MVADERGVGAGKVNNLPRQTLPDITDKTELVQDIERLTDLLRRKNNLVLLKKEMGTE